MPVGTHPRQRKVPDDGDYIVQVCPAENMTIGLDFIIGIPEPTSGLLACVAILGLIGLCRRRGSCCQSDACRVG
jgi:hypothetical protein